MGGRCFRMRDVASLFESAQDVRGFRQNEFGRRERTSGEDGLRPAPIFARVNERGDKHRRVDDSAHALSASRASMINDPGMMVPAVSLRRLTSASSVGGDG